MRQDLRAPYARALRQARYDAYPAGQYVGQESFMTADEIRMLAAQCGIGAGTAILDLCCGVSGPGRLIAVETGCDYLGVDYSASAIEIARERAGGLRCRFLEGRVPPVPSGPYDAVLLLETMLAFPDPRPVLHGVAQALVPGGAFGATVEVGAPLTCAERARMPDADTVHLVELGRLSMLLAEAGLSVTWTHECTAAHHAVATALLAALCDRSAEIAPHIGPRALDDLLAAHRLWVDWLGSGRVRKYALVARKQDTRSGEQGLDPRRHHGA